MLKVSCTYSVRDKTATSSVSMPEGTVEDLIEWLDKINTYYVDMPNLKVSVEFSG